MDIKSVCPPLHGSAKNMEHRDQDMEGGNGGVNDERTEATMRAGHGRRLTRSRLLR